MHHGKGLIAALVFAALAVIMLFAISAWFGNLNQDEGWYLYAARMVSEGKVLYRDFHFSQSPLVPLVYGLAHPLWSGAGVLGGRIVTGCFALAALALACVTAWRLCSNPTLRISTALAALLLGGANVFVAWYFTMVKTYALAALFLSAGGLALTYVGSRRSVAASLLCGVFMAAAAGTRSSLGLALPVAGLFLLFRGRHLGHARAWLWFGVGGVGTLLIIFAPFLVMSPDNLIFDLTLHGGREVGGFFSTMLFKCGFLARCAQSYMTPLLLGLLVLAVWICLPRRKWNRETELSAGLLAILGGVSLFHLMTGFPYDDYQMPLLPVFAAVVSAAFWNTFSCFVPANECAARRAHGCALASILLLSGVGCAASPVLESWVSIRQDRLWFITKTSTDVSQLRTVGRWIRENSHETDLLLTWDPYLAVEARRRLPRGFELAPFNYFPHLPDETARRIGVLNSNLLFETLTSTQAMVAALSGYAMAVRAPAMAELPPSDPVVVRAMEIIVKRYRQLDRIQNFGQGHTTLTLWKMQ